jgi:signal transduction histidine kinase
MEKFLSFLNQRIEEFGGAQYRAFGIFGVINYPVGYYLFQFLGSDENFVTRLIAAFLCFPLCITDYWPPSLKKYLNLYWLLTLLYCLPTFATYSLLSNQLSNEWLLTYSVGLFILFLLVDYVLLITLYGLGIFLGYLLFKLSGQNLIPLEKVPTTFLYLYAAILVIGAIFSRNKEYYTKRKIEEAKLQSVKMLAATIAHELRTPLASVEMLGEGLKERFPILLETQRKAQEQDKSTPYIHSFQLKGMAEIPDLLKIIARQAFVIIDTVLMNVRYAVPLAKNRCSMLDCVREAIKEYPLYEDDKALITVKDQDNFDFYGNSTLMKYVLFNLIKNGIYYIKAARKGTIQIWTELGKDINKLCFEDTGRGIAAEDLGHIFDEFYTKTPYGSGIGLAFCKFVMKQFDGDIKCESEQGKFTRFTLLFPMAPEGSMPAVSLD